MAPSVDPLLLTGASQGRSKQSIISALLQGYRGLQSDIFPGTGFPDDDANVAAYLIGAKNEGLRTRIIATSVIFVVSLFASSFPSLSRRVSFLRIPRIVFFIGKHFGTGVILSTAFVHLLQDAFEALRDPLVRSRWKIGDYAGLIVLGSLLSIFLVEYISTSYVDRLHSYNSPPASPGTTPRNGSPARVDSGPSGSLTPKSVDATTADPECTPLISAHHHHYSHHHRPSPSPRRAQTFSYGSAHHGHTHASENSETSVFFEGHHRHEPRGSHASHHDRGPRISSMYGPEEFGQGHPSGVGHIHDREGDHPHHSHSLEGEDATGHSLHGSDFHGHGETEEVRVGKKRQVVGILVLQLGIMIHSSVIGLTLSITSGPEFTSLLVAIIFHQLFEGLSLGIRIASLPSSREHEFEYLSVLKPVLASLFAITTPVGIVFGILVFGHSEDMAHMRLTQGLMSAISAGMLIYAGCVEMLAGDFVMDPTLWRSGLWKQTLALVSLMAGVVAMALVGS
ncbi:hypothetical protein HYDPIDRAFT_126962 [Hydnomerulius pinastri MD-312]|nr:hypothetical protein HYDPIDRAFT_126962 [Hydnomerulius pinastri MD-312]